MELTPQQITALNTLHARGFEIVAFPMYATYVGARKGNCAALLAPIEAGTFKIFGAPAYLIEGNLAVRITQKNREYFVWKKNQLEATSERLAELGAFSTSLTDALLPTL
jgi:hypothetical protein